MVRGDMRSSETVGMAQKHAGGRECWERGESDWVVPQAAAGGNLCMPTHGAREALIAMGRTVGSPAEKSEGCVLERISAIGRACCRYSADLLSTVTAPRYARRSVLRGLWRRRTVINEAISTVKSGWHPVSLFRFIRRLRVVVTYYSSTVLQAYSSVLARSR
jgi:hypothetical protein